MVARRFGRWTDYGANSAVCKTHGPQFTGPTLYDPDAQTHSMWLCWECLFDLVGQFAGGHDLPDLNATRR